MKQKKNIGFGWRGIMLLIYQFLAFVGFTVFTNWPMNILTTELPDIYGSSQSTSILYTICMLVGIVIQLVLSRYVGKIKSIKWMSVIFGVISIIGALGVALIPGGPLWTVSYALVCIFSVVYGMFAIGILVGQWFPRRKGTFMGIATFAFPIVNGLIAPFANAVFKYMPTTHELNVTGAFLPYIILYIVGLLIGAIFIKDYPEQCGAYRDNDKSFTPEMANAMMMEEIENKKTTVWKLGNTLKSTQFWLITIPMGALLMCSVGLMTQTNAIIGAYPELPFEGVMAMVMIVACFGSWLLGVIDTKYGTKLAVTISVVIMLLSGILGGIGKTLTTTIAIVLLAIFMGAGTNFTVSAAAQYWRREDFPSVFAAVNPVANVLQCIGPMMVTMAVAKNVTAPFWITAVIAVISLVLVLCFKPSKVKETDDKYRAAAGKPLDDTLAERK